MGYGNTIVFNMATPISGADEIRSARQFLQYLENAIQVAEEEEKENELKFQSRRKVKDIKVINKIMKRKFCTTIIVLLVCINDTMAQFINQMNPDIFD